MKKSELVNELQDFFDHFSNLEGYFTLKPLRKLIKKLQEEDVDNNE